MHTTISYDQATVKERTAAALRDCKAYLGESAYDKVLKGIRAYWEENQGHSKTTLYRGSRMALSLFVGIEGRYPVRAMVRAALTKEEVKRPHLTLILTGAMRTVDFDPTDPLEGIRPALEEVTPQPQHVFSRDGTVRGDLLGTVKCCPHRSHRHACDDECLGVRWPDGEVSYPCTSGLRKRPDGQLQIW